MLAGANFLYHGLETAFTSAAVDNFMRIAHGLYDEISPNGTRPLLMKDLLPYVPKRLVSFSEVAGPLQDTATISSSAEPPPLPDCEDITLSPLTDILRRCRGEQESSALIVTIGEHTTAYLFDNEGHGYHFDPLPASLTQHVDDARPYGAQSSSRQPTGGVYEGLLLRIPRAEAAQHVKPPLRL